MIFYCRYYLNNPINEELRPNVWEKEEQSTLNNLKTIWEEKMKKSKILM